jgi:hypothetical protein
MHLSRYGIRNKKFFKNFGFGQKTLARFWRTNVSYKRLIQVFYTTVRIHNLSRDKERGYSNNDHKKRVCFKPQKGTKKAHKRRNKFKIVICK